MYPYIDFLVSFVIVAEPIHKVFEACAVSDTKLATAKPVSAQRCRARYASPCQPVGISFGTPVGVQHRR